MKTSTLIALAAIGVALAAPVSAHHNSPWGEDGIEIGDMQGNHDAAIETLPDTPGTREMDPADSLMPDDIVPQPNGVSIPDTVPDDTLGPVNTPNVP